MKHASLRHGARLLALILGLLLLAPDAAFAQQRNERIHAIKVGYLTDRLKLSPEQATAFWPIYNAYEAELRKTRTAYRMSQRQAGTPANDAEATRIIDDNLDYQEAVLSINKQYRDRFLKAISATQLATLYEAERDFRKLLIQQLRDRREK